MASCETCKHQNKPAHVEPCKGCKHNATDNYQPITRADRIRSMTDEELAEFLLSNLCESMGFDECPQEDEFLDIKNIKNVCGNCVGEWLKSEVENDETNC